MKPPSKPPGRAAWHESGHVLVSAALARHDLDIPTSVVALGNETGWTEGLMLMQGTYEEWQDPLAGLVAGGVALDLWGDADPWRGADNDLEQAQDIATGIDPDRPQLLVDTAKQRARSILWQREDALYALARALADNHGRLAGRELKDALAWAWQGRVWSREAAFDEMVAKRNEDERRRRARRSPHARIAEEAERVDTLRREFFEAALAEYVDVHVVEPDPDERLYLLDKAEARALAIVAPLGLTPGQPRLYSWSFLDD